MESTKCFGKEGHGYQVSCVNILILADLLERWYTSNILDTPQTCKNVAKTEWF